MKLKNAEFVVDETNPFKNDALQREKVGINLAQFLRSLQDVPFVMSISASWGTGKTTFVKMLQQLLRNDGVMTLYFNAWESDFADPLIGFMSEIQEQIVESDLGRKAELREKFEKAKNVGISVTKRALPAAIKLATAGILDVNEVSEEILSGIAEELAKAGLEEFQSAKKSVASFRKELGEFSKAVQAERKQGPIIIFVDELDRCRPSFSIALLERIKHLFNVAGIVFVLVIDRYELGNAISAEYGIENPDGYLTRFIDLDYRLPRSSPKAFVAMLFSGLGINAMFVRDGARRQSLEEAVLFFSEIHGSSLRTIERTLTQIAILTRLDTTWPRAYPYLTAFLVFLKQHQPHKYDLYTGKRMSIGEKTELVRSLVFHTNVSTNKMKLFAQLEAYIVSGFCDIDEKEQIETYYRRQIADGNLSPETHSWAEEVLSAVSRNFGPGEYVQAQKVTEAIEFVQGFSEPNRPYD